MKPAAATTPTPAMRHAHTKFEPATAGGSGRRSGASARLVRSSAIATSPTNVVPCWCDRFHDVPADSSAALHDALSPFRLAPAGLLSRLRFRAFFCAYFDGSSFDDPGSSFRTGALMRRTAH